MALHPFHEQIFQAALLKYLFRGTEKDQMAFANNGHLVAQFFRHFQDVGGEENRGAFFRCHGLKGFPNGFRGHGIQAHEGLVKDDELGIVDQSGDQGQLLLHAVAVIVDGLASSVANSEEIRIIFDAVTAGFVIQLKDIGDEI